MPSQLKLFSQSLSKKPYCSDNLEHGLIVRSLKNALEKRYIQHNQPNSKLWLVYDIDRPTAPEELTDDLNLPAPHIFVQNPKNQHAHAFYGLQVPVHFNESSSKAAIRFAGALDAGLTAKMDADASYSGLICKNPLNQHWKTWYANHAHYELSEIAEYIDLSPYKDRRRALPDVGLARNCNLFEHLRTWSYRAIRQGWPNWEQWLNACETRALGYNINLDNGGKGPLELLEVRHISKSVANWTYRNFSPQSFEEYVARTHTSEVQAIRGSKGGKAKGKANESKHASAILMRSKGMSYRDIGHELGVNHQTIKNWVSK